MSKTLIIVALISVIPSSIAAILGLLSFIRSYKNATAIQEVHLSLNGRLTELLETTKDKAQAEGQEEGRIKELDRIK